MDEKTAELRDIFTDVAESDTVTETQEESRGSLARDEEAIEERIRSVVESMLDRYDLDAGLAIDELIEVVKAFYDGKSDDEITATLERDVSTDEIARTRIELHLVTEDDRSPPADRGEIRDRLAEDAPSDAIAAEFDVSEASVERYRLALSIEDERRVIGDRFRQEFEAILEDRDLSERLTAEMQADGLEEATEGIETDVSF